MRRIKAGVLALFGCVLVSGCANNRYLAPATTFRDSTIKTISTVSAFYKSRNSAELDIYLTDAAADSSVKLEETDAGGTQTPLVKPTFTPKQIKARLDALALVGAYASRLCELTNSTAAADFSDANAALGKDLFTLSNRFQSLSASGDQTAGGYVQPITTLVTALGAMYINHERNRMVQDAVTHGAQPVDTILTQISDDINNVFALQVSAAAHQKLTTLIRAYNSDRAQLSYEQRVSRLAEVKAAAESSSELTTTALAQLIAAMKGANDALLDATKQKHTSFADLNKALNTWSGQLQTLASQIQPLVK